jgi:Fe-S-cluster-containing dehydrogenase component/DMSO reductase anchor subunit
MNPVSSTARDDQLAGASLKYSLPVIDPPAAPVDDSGIVKRLLADQQSLTAVEEFSTAHDSGLPEQSQYYSRLLPASPPGPGQQYAFEVDLDRCSGCKACVTACHSLNGLDEHETWRDVGLLMGGSVSNPVMQHVTTACHHCLEPACMIACPVDAYEKDPETGIVKHLDDQCFGCQYCTLACPYDVPKYHSGKGIVRKCDMCSDRLDDGEAPACVQACPHEAIAIQIVETEQVIEDAEISHFLPAAPDPQMTLPTTTFKTSKVFPRNTLPVDYHSVNPQHPHWPLIIMLVLTQLSVGAFLVGMILEQFLATTELSAFRQIHATNALVVGLVALAASTMHLGRPQYAFRAVIGLRHSWLSREILTFGAFAGSACLYAAICWADPTSEWLPILGGTVAGTGILGLFCSIMIYVFTGREFWSFGLTASKFVLTATVLGITATLASIVIHSLMNDTSNAQTRTAHACKSLLQALVAAGVAKLALELSVFRHLLSRRQSPMKRSARLLAGPLHQSTSLRYPLGLLGVVVLPLLLWNNLGDTQIGSASVVIVTGLLFLTSFLGEVIERYQFFAACAAPRMPGRLNP